MTVNERLFVAGLLSSFEAAAKEGDRDALIALLSKVDLAGQGQQIADSVLSRSDPGLLSRRSCAPIRRNKEGREIWFDRWLWSYMPCHWKGWVLIATIAASANSGVWLLIWLFHAKDDDAGPFFFLLLPMVIVGWVMAERHSPSRS